MWPSLKPSQRAAILAAINPQSAAAAVTTAYVDATQFIHHLATLNIGAISAGGTVNAQVMQALDNVGTGAVAAKVFTPLTQTAGNSNVVCEMNLSSTDLNFNNGFKFVALQIIPSGAAALIAGELIGFDPHYNTADASPLAISEQIVF